MSTHEHDPFAPNDPAAPPSTADPSSNVPVGSTVPHHLVGALPPADPADPFIGLSIASSTNAFGVHTFDHASALNANPFTATDSDAAAASSNPSGNPLATPGSASPAGEPFGE